MRNVRLMTLRGCLAAVPVLAVLGCNSERLGSSCDPDFQVTDTASSFQEIAGDSVVTPLLTWVVGAPQPTDSLEVWGIEVIHAFHYQPSLLVHGRAQAIRDYVEHRTGSANEDIRVELGVPVDLMWCPRAGA